MNLPISELELSLLCPTAYQLLGEKMAKATPTAKLRARAFEVNYGLVCGSNEVHVSSVAVSRCWVTIDDKSEHKALVAFVEREHGKLHGPLDHSKPPASCRFEDTVKPLLKKAADEGRPVAIVVLGADI